MPGDNWCSEKAIPQQINPNAGDIQHLPSRRPTVALGEGGGYAQDQSRGEWGIGAFNRATNWEAMRRWQAENSLGRKHYQYTVG